MHIINRFFIVAFSNAISNWTIMHEKRNLNIPFVIIPID